MAKRRFGRKKASRRSYGRMKRAGKKDRRIPLFTTAGAAIYGYNAYKGGLGMAEYTTQQKLDYTLTGLTGMRVGSATGDGTAVKWDSGIFINTWTPVAVGIAGSMIAGKTGINRYLRKVPLVGKHIKL